MKFKKIMLLAASALMLAGVTGCNSNSVSPVNNEEAIEEIEELPAPRNLKISNDPEVSNFVKNQDFDPNKALAIDLRPTTTLDTTCTGQEDGKRLIVTKKEIHKATDGSGS